MSILQLSSTKVELPARDAPPSGRAGTSALSEAPFAALLDDERTRSSDGAGGGRQAAPASSSVKPGDEATTADVGLSAAATAAPVDVPATPPAVPTSAVAAPAVAAEADADAPVLASTPGAAAPTLVTVATPAVTPRIADPAVPAGPAIAPASVDTTSAGSAVTGQAVPSAAPAPPGESIATPEGDGANPQSAAPRTTPTHDGAPSRTLPDAPQAEASEAPRASAESVTNLAKAIGSATARSAADAAPQAAAAPSPSAGSAAIAPATPQQLDGPATAAATLPSRAVGLDRAVETVRLALSAAADRGVTQARIALNPKELGGIEIHLRHTPEGLVARVVAEHAGAAQLLQHAGAELRRSLEAQGLTLLQLDIGASGEQGHSAAGEQRGFGETSDRRDGSTACTTADDPTTGPTADGGPAGNQPLSLSNGVLVDVLA